MEMRQFDIIWKTLETEAANLIQGDAALFRFRGDCKDKLYATYEELRAYAKKQYMVDSTELIDRHKIAAIYMMAMLFVRPIEYLKPAPKNSGKDWLLNEKFTITLGLSILREFIINNPKSTPAQKQRLKHGFRFPDVDHGSYGENWAVELYWGVKNRDLSVLPLAHELFLLEYYNLHLNNSDKKPGE
jgi:hypothetical protein